MTTRILTRRHVVGLLDMPDCIEAVEAAFRAHAEGRSIPPAALGAHVDGGAFHVKAAGLLGDRAYFAAKLNGNFEHNAARGLPRIQGLIVLCDAADGSPLAVMDSTEITALRTAAASAVAARWLARRDADTATIFGCGIQGHTQLAAIRCVRPIRKVFLIDRDAAAAEHMARALDELEVEIVAPARAADASRRSAIVVTCTPSRRPILDPEDVTAGTFVAAVGADSEDKQEIDAALLARSKLVVDQREQCAAIGDLHHALAAGAMALSDVHAELSEVVGGRRPGREADTEITVFDSTGVALQDVAAAALVYERAEAAGAGTTSALLAP